ncbi:hypothetical protein C8R48DRAFT_764826 [Suillus tomentosus]|nr:hypothetical protein C8R48DRAFT_764826 [Suillus tomentosus]
MIGDTGYKSMTIGDARVIPASKNKDEHKNDFGSDDASSAEDDRRSKYCRCQMHPSQNYAKIIDLWERNIYYKWHSMNWMDRSAIQPSREDLKPVSRRIWCTESLTGGLDAGIKRSHVTIQQRLEYLLGQLASSFAIHLVKFTFHFRTKNLKVYCRKILVRWTGTKAVRGDLYDA